MKRRVLLLLLSIGLLLTSCADKGDEKESEVILLELNQDTQGSGTKTDLYTQFLNNEASALVENDYPWYGLEKGDFYTLTELGEAVMQEYITFFDPNYTDRTTYNSVQYTYVSCPDSDSRNLLIKFVGLNIYSIDDDSFAVYVLSEKNGQLYLTDKYECWARSSVTVYRDGLCSSDATAGAGDNFTGIDAIMSNGKVTSVYNEQVLNGWWTSHVNESIYNEVFGTDMEVKAQLNVSIFTIGENKYYTYDLSECTQEQIPLCETYINQCRDEAGINWITDEEVQQLIRDKCSSMSIDCNSIGQQQEPEWINARFSL